MKVDMTRRWTSLTRHMVFLPPSPPPLLLLLLLMTMMTICPISGEHSLTSQRHSDFIHLHDVSTSDVGMVTAGAGHADTSRVLGTSPRRPSIGVELHAGRTGYRPRPLRQSPGDHVTPPPARQTIVNNALAAASTAGVKGWEAGAQSSVITTPDRLKNDALTTPRRLTDVTKRRRRDVTRPLLHQKHNVAVHRRIVSSHSQRLVSTSGTEPEIEMRRPRRDTNYVNNTGSEDTYADKATFTSEMTSSSSMTSSDVTSSGESGMTSANESVREVDSGDVELSYRSRGNYAALVDPLYSARAATGSKWRPLASDWSTTEHSDTTTWDQSTTSTVGEEMDRNFSLLASIDVVVQTTNNSNSTSIEIFATGASLRVLKPEMVDENETLNDRKCINTAGVGADLELALRSRLTPVGFAALVYSLSSVYGLLLTWAVIGLILTTRDKWLPGSSSSSSTRIDGCHRLPPQLVPGLVCVAAGTRAMYFGCVECQLLLSPPGVRRVIYELYFPLVLAAYVTHYRLADPVTQTGNRNRVKDSCSIVSVATWLGIYGAFVTAICFLIDFSLIGCEFISGLRVVFVASVCLIFFDQVRGRRTSGSCVLSRVSVCSLLFVSAVFSALDAALILSDGISVLFTENIYVMMTSLALSHLSEVAVCALLCNCRRSILLSSRDHNKVKDVINGVGNGHGQQVMTTGKYRDSNLRSSPHSRMPRSLQVLRRMLKNPKVTDYDGQRSPRTSTVPAISWTGAGMMASSPAQRVVKSCGQSRRSRSMLYSDGGFLRFRVDGDTDGDSDARTLDDDDVAPGGTHGGRSCPASQLASTDNLSTSAGAASTGHSLSASPSLTTFHAPSIHLQESIDRALDRCAIWRVGRDNGQLSIDELQRVVETYNDGGSRVRRHRLAGSQPL